MAPRRGPRPTRDPKPIFQGLVIAVTGFIGETWTDANVSRWISLRKGSLVQQMDASVTHLVCTQEEVKNRTPKVREAIKRGSKHVKMVSKDWLEDSMHAERRLPEASFSPMKAIQKEKKEEMRGKQAEKGIEQAKKTVDTNYFHHYMDGTYFTYVVTLTRNDETLGAFGERYVLFLEESNAKPHLYLFYAKYYKSKGNTHAHIHRPTDTPGRFEDQFNHFKSFFQIKTNIPWEERLIKAGTTEKKFFQYTPPTSELDLIQDEDVEEQLTQTPSSNKGRGQTPRLGTEGVREARPAGDTPTARATAAANRGRGRGRGRAPRASRPRNPRGSQRGRDGAAGRGNAVSGRDGNVRPAQIPNTRPNPPGSGQPRAPLPTPRATHFQPPRATPFQPWTQPWQPPPPPQPTIHPHLHHADEQRLHRQRLYELHLHQQRTPCRHCPCHSRTSLAPLAPIPEPDAASDAATTGSENRNHHRLNSEDNLTARLTDLSLLERHLEYQDNMARVTSALGRMDVDVDETPDDQKKDVDVDETPGDQKTTGAKTKKAASKKKIKEARKGRKRRDKVSDRRVADKAKRRRRDSNGGMGDEGDGDGNEVGGWCCLV